MLSWKSTPVRVVLLVLTWGMLGTSARLHAADEPKKIRVTVAAILASEHSAQVDPKLECIAREVMKLEPKLTCFRLARTTSKSLPVAGTELFDLIDKEIVTVGVEHGPDKEQRVGLKVKPPGLGEITYDTACGKCFPIVTRYRTSADERLIIAIMVKPCDGK